MIKKITSIIWPIIVFSNLIGQTVLGPTAKLDTEWYKDAFIIKEYSIPENSKPIIIAIVDDGFRLTHVSFKGYLYVNTKEISNNFKDDDGNGFIDDDLGWDVSDIDNDVSIPSGREKEYSHGTYIAGVIARTLELTFGKNAEKYFKILPVKALSSTVDQLYIKDGYKGIEYAINNGADIVCCAWSGGILTREEEAILIQAKEKGVIVLGATGNTFSEVDLPPASHESVVAIAAITEDYKKNIASNYGMFVDLCAPGRNVIGADVGSDKGLASGSATSAAVAAATAGVAMLKALHPTISKAKLLTSLKNTAKVLIPDDARFDGKLGAGFFNLNEAHNYLSNTNYAMAHFNSSLSEGVIVFNNSQRLKKYSVTIEPDGAYSGIRFNKIKGQVGLSKKLDNSVLKFYNKDGSLSQEFDLGDMPDNFFVEGSSANVEIDFKSGSKKLAVDIMYEVVTVDSSSLYCKGIKYYELEKDTITDGSMDNPYANYSSCKWIIKVSEGKQVQFVFNEMDTQANKDYVYLFDGETAIPSNIIAKFSGQKIPPVVKSRGNIVLVWFVSDNTITGKGWEFYYKAVD